MDDATEDRTNAVQTPLSLGSGTLGTGGSIRDWTIGEIIGRGGSSVVYDATRSGSGFEQHAALKVLETGAADARFVARFERERRILLQLVHPHIVRLIDGGTTDTGRPWYAMERIDGVPLTDWSADRPLQERIRCLIAVCRAVDFAHQRLVVHCDLKPANVLVDADDIPHVLDFGIARLLDEHENTGTLQLLTPRWAAPEQLEGESVTTQTDVFALGLLTWAVLTGASPREHATGAALLASAREPLPAPSTHRPDCRGDLDAIVLRATAPDPSDRYRSAAELADDLERHLAGDAVQAREGMLWYRASRWIRRNRAPVAGLLLIGVLLAGWATSVTVQSGRIATERDRAQLQAERAEETLDLFVGILEAADPAHARGESLTVKEVLRSSVRELDVTSADPALAGEVRYAIGRVQYASGASEDARTSIEAARDALHTAYGPDHRQTLRAELLLARMDAGEAHTAAEPVDRAEAILERFREGPRDRHLAQAILTVADLSAIVGRFDRARTLADEARALFIAADDPRSAARAQAVEGYVACRVEEVTEPLLQALNETEAVLQTRVHPDIADLLQELSQCSHGTDQGREWAREALDLRRELIGESWLLATALNNYGLWVESLDPREAIELTEEAWRMAARVRGPDHVQTVRLVLNAASVRIDSGPDEASVEQGLSMLREVAEDPDGDPFNRGTAYRLLAQHHAAQGAEATARTLYERGLATNPPQGVADRLQTALDALP